MRKWMWVLPILALLSGCMHQQVMTRGSYASVEPGMSIKEMEKICGEPYAIHSRDGNSDIYEYIERIYMGSSVVEQRSYFIVISGGKVVGKYMKFSSSPAFDAIYSEDPYPSY